MMQAAVRVFAAKGYHAATVRDIVSTADVAVGTFYFYFPDKETLFVHLYEETADFLLRTIYQAMQNKRGALNQLEHGIRAYMNLAIYEPAVVQLLLLAGLGAVPALAAKRTRFREQTQKLWQRPLDEAAALPAQNNPISAAAIAGACDEVVLYVLSRPNPDAAAESALPALLQFIRWGTGSGKS
jgi:AcrR family transcriptional regulator